MDICNAFSLFSCLSILPVDTLSLVFQEPSIFSLHFGSRVPASSQRHVTQPALPTKAAQRKLRRCCKRRIRASKICDVKAVVWWVVSVICCREWSTKVTSGKKNNFLASWGVGIRLQKVSMRGIQKVLNPHLGARNHCPLRGVQKGLICLIFPYFRTFEFPKNQAI